MSSITADQMVSRTSVGEGEWLRRMARITTSMATALSVRIIVP